jgi:hypothetical protein
MINKISDIAFDFPMQNFEVVQQHKVIGAELPE